MTEQTDTNSFLQPFDPGFDVPDHRFDQRNEMFKRPWWDKAFEQPRKGFYEDVVYQDKPGWGQLEYAARNAAWNLEWGYALSVAGSGFGLLEWDGHVKRGERFMAAGSRQKSSPLEMTRWVKAAALSYGASLAGVAAIHPNWVYSNEMNMLRQDHLPVELPTGVNRAVVMAIEMDYQTIRSSGQVIQGVATGVGYSKMAFSANLLAAFIRYLGYKAIPCGNDTALSIPLAMAAGLGESSRMGLLVTKSYGPRVRLCKVLTDMPLQPDGYKPFGVKEFCQRCKLCAINCPSQSIPSGDMTDQGFNISNHHGPRKWYINAETCFQFWGRKRMDCTRCISICPFNKPPGLIHNLARSLIKLKQPVLNNMLIWIDEIMGYHRRYPIDRFWDRAAPDGE